MSDHFVFLALGLGNGAVYAALGLALVMTFRSSGVVNFATGAIALYVAYTYGFLRKGELLNPIPGMPTTVDLGGPWGFVPALALSLLIAAVLGVVLYGLVFRLVRNAPPVAKAVVSIGVMLVVQALLALRVGTTPVSVKPILPNGALTVAGMRIPQDRLWFAVLMIAMTVVLVCLFRYTRFGLATRAAAESEKGALVTGLSPDRIAFGNWALSTVVAGIGGILIAPIVPLVPVSYSLFVIPALAAALVGNFTAMGVTVAAGFAIGMLQSEMTHLQATVDWFPQSGMAELVPLVLILAFLVVRGKPLPTRGAIVRSSLGRAPRPRRILLPTLIGVVVAILALTLTSGSYRAAVIVSLVLAIIGLSQVVVTGFAGQISLAQLPLAGVGAFTLSRLTTDWGIPFPLAPILGALAATVIGVIVGLPALRIRGLPVTVVTLALAVFLEFVWFRNTDLNGGMQGAQVEPPTLFGIDLSIGSGAGYPRVAFGFLCLAVLVIVAVAVAKLRTGRLGAAMLAVRADERAAAASGIDVSRTKLLAFAIGAFIAGLGGSLMAYQQTVVTAESYTTIGGIALFAMIYIAGVTLVSGGILSGVLGTGGLMFILLDRLLGFADYYAIIGGVLLTFTVISYPEGIAGHFAERIARLQAALRARSGRPEKTDVAVPIDTQTELSTMLSGGPEGAVVLTADGLTVTHGAVTALADFSIEVRSGEIVGLIGPNGAGKTTCIDALSGFADASGAVTLEGRRIDGLVPHRRSRLGLGRTFQDMSLYEDLSVRENVAVGTFTAGPRAGKAGGPWIDTLFRILDLESCADDPVAELSQGRKQLVSVARALAGRPRMLLLDEPAAGLASSESRWLGEKLRAVRNAGVTVLIVDHDMDLVLELCDRIVVLDLGRIIADGTPDEIRGNPAVVAAYLGATREGAGELMTTASAGELMTTAKAEAGS
ncbi:ABC transporter permease subunit [Rhodococcus rhodochrous]|uniref:ABC transporter permease subunit n=1 Tax=Rhodococcus rhodochrous TaxID=1829 RepID=UPI00188A695A|nr:branched-chain amino acid ABC transporter permease/ATP-binding protein [Rhodococcus rhodochrous]MBF4479210.1 ATP-binding cassette domain-containing protein [Rhodococcus rhodochrous]